jgi:hypothetical protein
MTKEFFLILTVRQGSSYPYLKLGAFEAQNIYVRFIYDNYIR